MQELTYSARRLYRREIVLFVIFGIILGPLSIVAQETSALVSLIFAMASLLGFVIGIVFLSLARWWIRPLTFSNDRVKFGAWEQSVSKLSGIEFRPERRWLIITLKPGGIRNIRLVQLTRTGCDENELSELRTWAMAHNLLFNRF